MKTMLSKLPRLAEWLLTAALHALIAQGNLREVGERLGKALHPLVDEYEDAVAGFLEGIADGLEDQ